MADNDDGLDTFREELRLKLVGMGAAAAEEWLSIRANRRMSDVNRRRLAGHVVNALWPEIERAAQELAMVDGPSFLRPETPSEATARADRAEDQRNKMRLQCGNADLRAARVRLVAASMAATFVEDDPRGDGLKRSRWVSAADVERWQAVVRETNLAVDTLRHFAGSYSVSTGHLWELDRSWVRVHHTLCQAVIFGSENSDPDSLDGAKLLTLMIEHRCEDTL